MRRLSPKQLAELSLAALANARNLFDDAVLLRHAGRTSSAFLLLGLAADELGKHVMVSAISGRDDTDAEWKKFWQRMGSHESKLGNALMGGWAGDLLSDDPLPDKAAFHRQRLSATYADVTADGEISLPRDVIEAHDVDRALNLIGRELKFCESALGAFAPDRLARHFESLRAAERSVASDASDRSPEEMLAWVLAVRSGIPEDEAAILAKAMADAAAQDAHRLQSGGPS
jgi:AbiV family abortive infection protein